MTFAPLKDGHGGELLTWFLAASHVRTSARLEKAQESTESDPACGGRWRELSVKYDRNSSSWKTHRCLWAEDLPASSLTLPRWGLMRDGVLSELATLERRIGEKESGLWPTPNAMPATSDLGFQCSGDGRKKPNKLGLAVAQQMYPTPLATNTKANHMRSGGRPARSYWATPTVFGNYNSSVASAKSGDGLATQAGGSLNPTWVEWLMGWPLGFTDLKPLGTDKCLQWLQQHGKC